MKYDIIFVSGEPYVDHPFSATGVLRRFLESEGFTVGIIESPDWKKDDDFKKLGEPNLFFGITSGAIDSMLVNYTPLKKRRDENEFSQMSYVMPDRAVTVYSNMIRKLFKGSKIVIGGTESSLRRFSHFDFWDNKIRKSILLDTRADILVYGYGELQILEIAKRIRDKKGLKGIDGTCVVSDELPKEFTEIPSAEKVESDKKIFCDMQNSIDTKKNVAQKNGNKYVLQYRMMKYTSKDLDKIYSLDFSRKIPKDYQEFKNFQFSVLTHRGCFGKCNFCSIAVNGGNKVISRSEKSILDEITKITKHPDFTGTLELSGASANMYGMDCSNYDSCIKNDCLKCKLLNSSHSSMLQLLRKARDIRGVKKIIVKSGIRYDLAMRNKEYVREIIKYHNDGRIMVAPEHIDHNVLKLMNKDYDINEFINSFKSICKEEKIKCELSYYTMVAHPGSTIESSEKLSKFITGNSNSDYVQIFTPTPMTVSTCMYYTGLEPSTKKEIYVPYTYNEKKRQKNIALGNNDERYEDKRNYNRREKKTYRTDSRTRERNPDQRKTHRT